MRGEAEAWHHHAAAVGRGAAAQGPGVSGTVRISASEVIGIEVLPPVLARLRRDHPRLTLELAPTNRVQNLLLREADIAVRMAPPKQEQLIARPVGHVDIGLYARKDYLRHRGTPATLADLAGHTLIGYDTEPPFLRGAGKRLAVPWSRDSFALRADRDLAPLARFRPRAGHGLRPVAPAPRRTARAP
ncbi:LysR substrate-binding domain-containing protein, partial [Achromobacter ruhlandii]